LEVI